MKNLKYIRSIFVILLCATIFTTSNTLMERVFAQPTQTVNLETVSQRDGRTIAPLQIVAHPEQYLNQKVLMKARFDKFSTLGLDYKSAFRSSDDYLSFLIKRDDTIYDIPLSEMKLFLKRELAEEFINLKSEDEILITGYVFSNALGDAWIDVTNLEITKKAPEKDGVE